jgi:uncharacterized membrane protein YoaK (UPF0700 family)
MSPFVIAVLLAWIAGFVDAVGYVAVAHVFPAHMSGNTAAFGAHFGGGQLADISERAFAIPMFVVGVFLGALMGRAMQQKGLRRRFAPSFILEGLLLTAFVALTSGLKRPVWISGARAFPLVAMLAIAMGLQNATLRRARGLAVRTTFITGMLVSMAERAAGYVARMFDRRRNRHPALDARRRKEGKEAMKYALLWCGMFFGAASGAALEIMLGTPAVLLPVFGLIVIIIQDFIRPISES